MSVTPIVSVGVIAFYMVAGQVSTPTPREARYDELDLVEPQSLQALVESADAVVVATIAGRAEARVQTHPLTIRGRVVNDRKVFARYAITPVEVIKAPTGVQFKDGSLVEEEVLAEGLARFEAGLPAVGDAEVLLFLNYYPYGGTFTIGTWRWQLLKRRDGGVQPVTDPSVHAAFLKEHPLLGNALSAARSDAWQMLLGEVKSFAQSRSR